MLETSLKERTWEDEYYATMNSIAVGYSEVCSYIDGDEDVRQGCENFANEVYFCAKEYKDQVLGSSRIPSADDIAQSFDEQVMEAVYHSAELLVNYDDYYIEMARGGEEKFSDAFSQAESDIYEQFSYSSCGAPESILTILDFMRYNYLMGQKSDYLYGSADLADDVYLSIGDAQNILFPALAQKTVDTFYDLTPMDIEYEKIGRPDGYRGSIIAIRELDEGKLLSTGR